MLTAFLNNLHIHAYIEKATSFFNGQKWLVHTLLLAAIAGVSTYWLYVLHRKLFRHSSPKREYLLLKNCVEAIYLPLVIFIWLQVLASRGNVLLIYMDSSVVSVIEKSRTVSALVLLLWSFIRFIKIFEVQLLQGVFQSKTTDKNTIQATGKILRVVAFVIVTLLILPILGVQIAGVTAFISGSAIIMGIAAQQVLSNYFGGIVVLTDTHFKVGDWIYSPDRNIEGVVEYIGWRSTHVRTFDRRLLYVPNSVFSSIVVINGSQMTHRRIKDTINIRYEDAPVASKILREINSMLQGHPGLDKSRRLAAHFNEFGPFSMKLTIYAFTHTIDWQIYRDIQQDIFLKIIKIINDNGAQVAIAPVVSTESKGKSS
jgi:MscS family membrane protein